MKTPANNTFNNMLPSILMVFIISVMSIYGVYAQNGTDLIPISTGRLQPGFNGGVGPVVSGSADYSKMPSKAQKFLAKHCDGHAVVRCEKNYSTGAFSISLADGIDIDFDAKGNLISIVAPANYSLSPTLLKAIVPGKLYNLLVNNGFKSSIESISRSKAGYRMSTADPVFEEVCYDTSGVLTLIVER